MVLANVPLVEHIVNRIASNLPSSHSRDDLVQTGIMGLIAATARFDPTMGAAFSTFAGRRIEGAIIDMLRQADWAPRSVRSLERRLTSAEERAQSKGSSRRAAMVELSSELGCDVEELHRLRADIAKARLDSLDRPVRTDDTEMPLAAVVVDQRRRAEEIVDDHELIGYLRDGVALLPERHRIVVVGYFFEGRSITDLGSLLGVTQSRASQIKDEALRLLRESLRAVYDEDPQCNPSSHTPSVGAVARSASGAPAPAAGDGRAPRRPGSSRQRTFNESLAASRGWRDRVAAGKGVTVTG